ncbi:helix-turn-helix domain-containing protein [Pseudomonas petrae]|uniref:Helix-turn-helix domain-containing protein n=1 Tax=Pseudomonas petrae TaxID=2912190 RepID=A0ABS9I4R2_9PSED|nr:helix-turn-helix transcriptional regulator [Pseudomonas petrae]MCF7532297.1 helix-turn-helix domain-containing protein [Pseudomonas petrae]MCF7535929.1 helix-turn-helix domain-containing protein [Pseudomonas petrae]MCF7542790.1 helix-turn-helix domain-containing protein [Pseudomonas petrae]MCF7554993.1 helix-turn-helix domain-containing protein [Pseudomonas petrae]
MLQTESAGSLGLKIRTFRKMRKLTVRRLADDSATSASMISQIENGKASPGLATMVRIAKALGLSLGDLVSDEEAAPRSRVVRKEERSFVEWGEASKKYLITPRPFQHVEAYELDLAPGDQIDDLTYGDTSILLVVTGGQGTVRVNDEFFDLREGDSLSFTTSETHGFANPGNTPFRALFVLTPPAIPLNGPVQD